MSGTETKKGWKTLWSKYKTVLAVTAAGVVLLLWPGGRQAERAAPEPEPESAEFQTLEEVRGRMEQILTHISGVGQLQLMLTLESDGRRELAQDTELAYSGQPAAPEDYQRGSQVVRLDGDDGEAVLVTQRTSPHYRGALVVCQGGDRADVKLAVTEAVAALTGLSSDRIAVSKWQ